MFDIATRNKYRFSTAKGELSVEQLWDVPLRSNDTFNLDRIARGLNKEIEAATEESFVDVDVDSPVTTMLQVKFGVVKQIIGVKVQEEKAARKQTENRAEREKLLRILAEKREGALSELSEKELQKRINNLS